MKKAQTAEAASALVAIIAAIIVLYILFMPSADREELLNTTDEDSEKESVKTIDENALVFEHPGMLDYLKETEREHSIPSVNLYTETESTVLKEIESVYVKNGWFANKPYVTDFKISDLANTENVIFSANVKQTRGRLIIMMNGEEIYNSQVGLGNMEPIKIEKKFLKETNVIEIRASGVGIAFWALNEYNLEDIKVTADVTDVSTKTSENIFIVSSTERENLEETRLRFLPDCLASQSGKLKVDINGKEVYNSVPDCGYPTTIDFLPEYIRSGENKIVFSTTKGRYFIDYITIKASLKEISYPIYYFELDADEIEEIEDDEANVTLEMEFVNGENKRADIIVNGHKTYMDTSDSTYEKVIDEFLEEGNNYVQITPRTVINVVDLKVVWND